VGHYETSITAGTTHIVEDHLVIVFIKIAIRADEADLPKRCMHVMKLTATPEET
jgi:hypothetical protein